MAEWRKIEEGEELGGGFTYGPRKVGLPDNHHVIIHQESKSESVIKFVAIRQVRGALQGIAQHGKGSRVMPTKEVIEALATKLGLERHLEEKHQLWKWPGTSVERATKMPKLRDKPVEAAPQGEKERPPTEYRQGEAESILLQAGFRKVVEGRFFHPEHGRIEWHPGRPIRLRKAVTRIWRIQQALRRLDKGE